MTSRPKEAQRWLQEHEKELPPYIEGNPQAVDRSHPDVRFRDADRPRVNGKRISLSSLSDPIALDEEGNEMTWLDLGLGDFKDAYSDYAAFIAGDSGWRDWYGMPDECDWRSVDRQERLLALLGDRWRQSVKLHRYYVSQGRKRKARKEKKYQNRLRKLLRDVLDCKNGWEEMLTKRQKEVLDLLREGYNQAEIARRLRVHRSQITRIIQRICDSTSGFLTDRLIDPKPIPPGVLETHRADMRPRRRAK